jgi:hypothetical protein
VFASASYELLRRAALSIFVPRAGVLCAGDESHRLFLPVDEIRFLESGSMKGASAEPA